MDIFVANYPFGSTVHEVTEAFEKYGTVERCRLVTDKTTGRDKGFGFVTMPNDDQARLAIQALNGTEFRGRQGLRVNQARSRGNDYKRGQ